jgi:hypothetical protein
MIRTIIQLTQEQHRVLKELAAEYHVSVSEMVRRSVDAMAQNKTKARSREEIRQRAMAAAGFIVDPNGPKDLSVNHDYYLEEVYAEENQNDDDLR